jgi:hypothetical protein
VPVLVRSHDDVPLERLQAAGATEVIPEIFETSLSLVAHVLVLLHVPTEEVTELSERIRSDRYSLLRSVFRRHDARPLDATTAGMRQQLRTVTLPPTAHAVGRSIRDLGFERGAVVVTAIRREGIVGRDPDPDTRLREGDVLVLFGTAEDLEQGSRACSWVERRACVASGRDRSSVAAGPLGARLAQQLRRIETEPIDRRQHARPVVLEKALLLALHELRTRAQCHEHPASASFLDQPFVDQLLITLEHRQRIQREFGRDVADRWQGVTIRQRALQYHRRHFVAELTIDGLIVVPGGIHATEWCGDALL